ncbi:alcohol dehydrogenase catalytic domain-containing protein [Herbiconiux aconitum]|uniref:alcohol dehydrogenase catalytic domain-containing protein n=1 Tax=Herbiconiux aconitum TaxID=2970913 RepID=UPI003556C588
MSRTWCADPSRKHADYVALPAITGHDISGVIEEVGSHVTEFRGRRGLLHSPDIRWHRLVRRAAHRRS